MVQFAEKTKAHLGKSSVALTSLLHQDTRERRRWEGRLRTQNGGTRQGQFLLVQDESGWAVRDAQHGCTTHSISHKKFLAPGGTIGCVAPKGGVGIGEMERKAADGNLTGDEPGPASRGGANQEFKVDEKASSCTRSRTTNGKTSRRKFSM